MSAGFTPGPWQLRNALSASVLAMREHTNHFGHKTAWLSPIAVAQPWEGEQRLANANLIAASPDGYAAAELAIQHMEWSTPQGRDAYDALKSFLAKARGETR